ncbi:multi-sensor signal transduction histidine kinase [Hydrogenophaga taeniospiralis CCUG 15921]|uniref:histidine kinase n=1 Tax=Hydrogenophaga taeniospiralis CCUG 15921 TaxID=1281780 RepID=A0A9X4NR65_9BURK|nr:PAS domain S-box protein [Hydrogenophaga taeniospiralis]MDG5975717.1 multi-sensor signal transduction histidine kinase [Hydrogenophaga taeniospiralis CCUG 15921]
MENSIFADDPLAPGQTGVIERHQEQAVRALLLTLSVAAPAIAGAVFLRDGASRVVVVIALLSVVLWALWLPFRHGRIRLVADALIGSMLLGTTLATALDGSVRSSAVTAMMATVVLAGSFLPRRGMIAVGIYCITVLGLFNWLEQRGIFVPGSMRMGWAVWLVHTSVISTILVSVFFGRFRLMKAYRRLAHSLNQTLAAEADLRASEERFRALFRGNPAACLVQSLGSRLVVDVNDAYADMSGFSRQEMIGQPPPLLWAKPAESEAFRAMLKAHGRVRGMRALGRRRDASLFEALLYAEVLHSGSERLLIVMVIDVSMEERARQALKKSEERFSKAFNFSPLGMTITRLSDGRYMEVNPASERVLGYSQADCAGKTALEVGIWLSPADRDEYTRRLRQDGHLLGYETHMRNKLGEVVEVRMWAESIELDGEPCALTFTINVAEEKRQRALLMNVAQGVSSATGEAFFLSLAERLAQAVGADGVVIGELSTDHKRLDTLALLRDGELRPHQTLGLEQTTYARILPHRDLQVEDISAQPLRRHTPPFDPDRVQTLAGMALRDPDGTAIGLLVATWGHRQVPEADTRALLTIFASRCNAELVRLRRDREICKLQDTLEQRVAARTEQLQYLNRELDAFAYTVSHDLKAPLRSIDGFMHLLQEQMAERLTPEDEDMLQRVAGSVARMNRLITDLLALARVSQGTLQRTSVNLSELARDVLRQECHRDPGREVEVVIAPDMVADCDPRMAQIVLENLLGNAWKYTRQQAHPRIELSQISAPPGEAPTFCVRDNGAGFEMTHSDRLFQPFTRLHSPLQFEGTGIGLATVRRIIERHGGHICGEGAVGKGASFWFSFGRPTLD